MNEDIFASESQAYQKHIGNSWAGLSKNLSTNNEKIINKKSQF